MYLKQIKAQGFKSFADKTEILLKPGTTCVVGPNGSGKSNIVDAIRWVLGEQSVKNLRGKNSMIDVIFSGSESRSSHNYAMVALTFDNRDRYLNSPFSEIEIKRMVYKTGENEYYINNSKVRLKDITDLFTDSGAGKESFNIISQGSVGDIINSKASDRRGIFEEAASVLKYKKRKEESIRKLDKTKDNLEKVDLVISELSTTIEPLRKQRESALLYKKYHEELSDVEISLITHDIGELNDRYEVIRDELKILGDEKNSLNHDNSGIINQIELNKLTLLKLDESINDYISKVTSINKEIADIEVKKQVILERKKHSVDDDLLKDDVLVLKEKLLDANNTKLSLKDEYDNYKIDLKKLEDKIENVNNEYNSIFRDINKLEEDVRYNSRMLLEGENKALILKNNIEQNNKVPYAVKNVLSNPRLKGIHNIVSNLIKIESKYQVAIDLILGASSSVIVVDNEKSAKEAIIYLKDNKLGRATFYPLSVIKSRYIDDSTMRLINVDGFINIASNLVDYDDLYDDVIKNILGNTIVVDNIDTLNKIGKLINYKYRVVSLDGEILYTGGSLSGGHSKNFSNVLDKSKLSELVDNNKLLELKNKEYQDKINNLRKSIESISSNRDKFLLEKVSLTELINVKEMSITKIDNEINDLERNLSNNEMSLSNSLDKELDSILTSLYDISAHRDRLSKELDKLKNQKTDINTLISDLENTNRIENGKYNKHLEKMKSLEIEESKIGVKLDNLLISLSDDYSLTYELAKSKYNLDIEVENARLIVGDLRTKIRKLGVVNLGAIEEFDRINERYEFLVNSREELLMAVGELNDLILEMDEIMVDKFKETFEKIQLEFTSVFKQLFKGGSGYLKLTDPDDLLNSGVEIIAEPPGKRLNSIDLLSGGEKTLTAIAVLFAILNVKPVPFCVLDEVEAALDEANVATFGNYLENKKENNQFIVITHKKKTMEYADVLYGITMQESGVSKLVSVNLEEKQGN